MACVRSRARASSCTCARCRADALLPWTRESDVRAHSQVVLAIERASMDDSCQTSFCETAADPTPEERILRRGW